MVDATDGIAIGVLHGCIGKCCTEKYPSVFVNLADEAIWNFVYKNAGLSCDEDGERGRAHCYFTRLNLRKMGSLQFCLPVFLGIHRNPKRIFFFNSCEGFLN